MKTLTEGRMVKGKYRLEQELARGGMGALWVAFDRKLRRRVAIKFLNPDMAASAEARARFEREAWSAARIRSEHVIQTYDYGVDRGLPYIVLELLHGEDLRNRLLRDLRLPYPAVLDLLGQIVTALDAVHAAGVVHRDLKPGNIFLERVGEEDVVKLLDFGVARAVIPEPGDEPTVSGLMLGTPRYMSPEQVQGETDVDARSDLWSLAVILYKALTGENAFVGASMGDLLASICSSIPRSPSTLAAGLPAGTDAFFKRALSRDPAGRFQSAREMLESFAALGRVSKTPEAPSPKLPDTVRPGRLVRAAPAAHGEQEAPTSHGREALLPALASSPSAPPGSITRPFPLVAVKKPEPGAKRPRVARALPSLPPELRFQRDATGPTQPCDALLDDGTLRSEGVPSARRVRAIRTAGLAVLTLALTAGAASWRAARSDAPAATIELLKPSMVPAEPVLTPLDPAPQPIVLPASSARPATYRRGGTRGPDRATPHRGARPASPDEPIEGIKLPMRAAVP